MNEEGLRLLFARYLRKTATTGEKQQLLEWIAHHEGSDTLLQQMSNQVSIPEHFSLELPEDVSRQILEAILLSNRRKKGLLKKEKVSWLTITKLLYAAAIALVFTCISGYFYLLPWKNEQSATILETNRVIEDALPGKDGALLITNIFIPI